MAGIFQDGGFFMGFDMDPAAATIFTQSALGVGDNSDTPYSFGYAWSNGNNTSGVLLNTNLTTLISGFRVKLGSLPATNGIIAGWFDATANGTQVTLRVTSTGSLQFYLGNTTSTPIGPASAGGLVTASNWNAWIECTVTISATVGFVECKVNGTTAITTAATQNTKNTANAWVNAFQIVGPVNPCRFDDLYLLDTTGSSPLNTYLGPVQVRGDKSNANSAVGGRNAWTPTNPQNNNHLNVGNIPANAAQYNADSTVGDYDMFAFPSLPSNVATVLAVDEWALTLLDSAGARTVVLNCYSNGTDSPGTAFTPGATAGYQNQVSVVDPHTSAAWTVANAGAAELGLKVQS